MASVVLFDARGEELPASKTGFPVWIFCLVTLALFAIPLFLHYAIPFFLLHRDSGTVKHDEGVIFLPSRLTLSYVGSEYRDVPETPVTDGDTLIAFDYALAAWRKALGRQIKRPGLLQGGTVHCDSEEAAIACVAIDKYRIILVRHGKQYDIRTVFLHEIGHLLGVPHIVGDPLMDPVYQGRSDAPSPYAVAIARLNESNAATHWP